MKLNLRDQTLQNTVLVIVLAAIIGIGVSIFVYAISCDGCQFDFPIVTAIKPTPEKICTSDPTCIPPKRGNAPPGRNFTDVGLKKVRALEELVRTPAIQNALKHSNEKDSKMSEEIRIQIYIQREKEWINSKELTPLMKSVIYNQVSDFLRDNLIIPSKDFGNLTFGEHILTNQYGGNVAISVKSDNYDQSRDDWWQYMFYDEQGLPFARECEFDKSADIFSEDLVIKINDNESGKFIGILNSATPCNVLSKPNTP